MKTATKRDLVVKISNETGMTQQQVFDVIQKTLDTITQTLASGDEVVLRNFGSFQVKETKQKIGRNPNKPGTDVVIPPRAIVKIQTWKRDERTSRKCFATNSKPRRNSSGAK